MDIAKLVLEYLTLFLSWPVVVLIIVLMFRKSIKTLLPTLKRLNWKEGTVEFDKGIEEVAKEAELALPQAPAPLEITVHDTVSVKTKDEVSFLKGASPTIETELKERFRQLADLHPAAAILESWLDLETELREVGKKRGISDSRRLPTIKIGNELRARGIWDEETFNIFVRLRELRNTVVHTRTGWITPAQALVYDEIIRRLIAKLRDS